LRKKEREWIEKGGKRGNKIIKKKKKLKDAKVNGSRADENALF
jgi:hypothetical protein